MKNKNLKSLLQTKQKTISRTTGYPSKKSGRDGDFQVRKISGQGIFLFYKWNNNWYSSRLTQYKPRTAEHKQPVKLPIGVKPVKEGHLSIKNGNISVGKSGNKTNTIISVDKDNIADRDTPVYFKRADTASMGDTEAKDPTFLIENTGHAHLRFYSPSNVYDQFLSFGRRHPETFTTNAWCMGLDSSANVFKLMYRSTSGTSASDHGVMSNVTPSAGDTYEQLSVTSTGVLRLGLIQNAGTDTDLFLVSDSENNGYVKFRTGANVLADIGGQASLTFGISDTNVTKCGAGIVDDDFIRVNGTTFEGRSAAEVRSDIGAGTSSVGALNDLSDVTYASGDLTIASLDKIIVAGDLDIIAAGGDINFKASEHGSGYDGGVNFNITSNQVEFIRDLQGGTPSRLTFNIGLTQHSINSANKLEFISDEICEFRHKSLVKPLAFDRDGLSLTTGNNWSGMAAFEDSINTTDSATGSDIYGLMRGHLRYLTTSGFNKVCLLRLESDAMLSSVAFVNYNATVAGTIKGTKTDHGYITGVTIEISGTTDYNGTGVVVTRIDDDNFYFTDTYTSDQSGTTQKSYTTIHTSDIYGKFSVEKNGSTYSKGSVNLLESADHPETPTATLGQVWVKTATPNELYFTTDAGDDIQITTGTATAGGGGTSRWHQTIGGYKINNNSTSNYYTFYRFGYDNWSNSDSSPTSLSNYDSYSTAFTAPADGTLTNIRIVGQANDTGAADAFKFYVYKAVPPHNGTTATATLIGTTSAISTSAATRVFNVSTDISSSNTFSAGDSLYVWLKKDATSGNQDLYFSVAISGEYD